MNKEEKEEVFEYLDELRESGETNMFGAASYIKKDFGYTEKQSIELLLEWMETFEERHKGQQFNGYVKVAKIRNKIEW